MLTIFESDQLAQGLRHCLHGGPQGFGRTIVGLQEGTLKLSRCSQHIVVSTKVGMAI